MLTNSGDHDLHLCPPQQPGHHKIQTQYVQHINCALQCLLECQKMTRDSNHTVCTIMFFFSNRRYTLNNRSLKYIIVATHMPKLMIENYDHITLAQ